MKMFVRVAMGAALAMQMGAGVAFADDDNTPIDNTMKQMGANMKVVVNALIKNQPVAPADLKAAADKLPALAAEANTELPPQLMDSNGQPLPSEAANIALFHQVMGDLQTALTHMQAAIDAGDNATATTVLKNEVAPVQKRGHDLFKPADN